MDGVNGNNAATAVAEAPNQKVLYITYDGLTGPLGQSQIIPYVIALTKVGYAFTILSFEKPDEFRSGHKKISQLLQRHRIGWAPLTFTSKPPLLSKFYDLVRMRTTALRLWREQQFELVHCRSYIAGQTGLLLKRKFGCRFLFDMRGFWVDERVDGNIWDLSKPFYRRLYNRYKLIEKTLLKGADRIIALTENGKQELVTAYDVPAGKVTVIPCCVDTDFFDPATVQPADVASLKAELSLTDRDYVLTYVGKLGTWYLLSEMLDFFAVLKARNRNAKFLLLVDYDAAKVRQQIVERGLEPADFIVRKVERSKVPLYLSLANSSVFFIKPSYSKIGSSPIKLGELMAMGIPVVCNTGVGDLDRIMSDEGLGTAISSFTPDAYQQAASTLFRNEFDAAYIRSKAVTEFSVENGAECYANVYAMIFQHTLAPLG